MTDAPKAPARCKTCGSRRSEPCYGPHPCRRFDAPAADTEAAEESGRVPEAPGSPPPPSVTSANPVGEREGTDSAATKLAVKITAKMIAAMAAE
jgi:hypothetical protein